MGLSVVFHEEQILALKYKNIWVYFIKTQQRTMGAYFWTLEKT